MTRPRLLFAAALAAVVALVLASAATPGRSGWRHGLQSARQELVVVPFDARLGSANADTGLDLIFPASQPAPAKVMLYSPFGYGLDLAIPPGTTIGTAEAFLSTSTTPLRGNIVVDSPARYAADPAAVACAGASPHAAVWVLQLAGATPTAVVVFLDPASGTEIGFGQYKLQACLGSPDAGAPRITELFVDLTRGVTNPAAPGEFVWRAFVTPFAPGNVANDAGTVEVRSVAPLPEGVILGAKVNAKNGTVTVSGVLILGGSPQSGLIVTVYSSAKANLITLTRVANLKTKANGGFSVTRKITKTTYFWAVVEGYYSDTCLTGPSTAPLGCVRETLAPAFANRATATVPKKKPKPKKK
jgi:hypothetical protein